jgi:integrase
VHTVVLSAFTAHMLAAGRAEGTVYRRVLYVQQLLAPHTVLGDVPTSALELFLAVRRHTHLPETRKAIRASFRVFFAWAERTGHIDRDPARELLPIRIPPAVPRVAPDAEIEQALSGAPLEEQAMILLARLACLRLTELATLRTEHRQGDAIRVLGKGGTQRLVYLHPAVLDALVALERRQGDGWYFPGRFTGHLHPQSVHKIMVRRTGWNPHSLRHAGATAAYRATGDLRAVQAMLGHASMATTQRYLHLDEEARRAAALGTGFRSAA